MMEALEGLEAHFVQYSGLTVRTTAPAIKTQSSTSVAKIWDVAADGSLTCEDDGSPALETDLKLLGCRAMRTLGCNNVELQSCRSAGRRNEKLCSALCRGDSLESVQIRLSIGVTTD